MKNSVTHAVWCLCLAGFLTSVPAHARTHYGFTPFPYDFTMEAIVKTDEIVRENGDLYALHFDNCVPWHEMLAGKPMPPDWQREWNQMEAKIPRSHTRYIAVTPTGTDRETLAPACGAKEGTTRSLPREIRGKRFDDPKVMEAYRRYVSLAVKKFRPQYINIGIEIDGMARSAGKWRQFEALFDYVRAALRKQDPNLKVGVEFILQGLMKPEISRRVKPLVERSDYLGLSFYPYGSDFGVLFGYPALPPPPDMWRKPMEWVRTYTDKPLAFCETGFITRDADMPSYNLHFKGSEALQTAFTRDLIRYTKRDNYAFVVWFLAIDYDKLYEKMPKNKETEFNLVWRNLGLFDQHLRPKPALQEWLQFRSDNVPPPEASPVIAGLETSQGGDRRKTKKKLGFFESLFAGDAADDVATAAADAPAKGRVEVGFSTRADLFKPGAGSRVDLDGEAAPTGGGAALRWQYRYSGDWQWIEKSFSPGTFAGVTRLRFDIRSDREGMLAVSAEEESGEGFFALVSPGTEWDEVVIDLDTMSVDDERRKNGTLEPEAINKLLIADGAAADGAKGKRTVWIANMRFE